MFIKHKSIEDEDRDYVSTNEAAHYLKREPQTLIKWACYGGLIKPIRIDRRLRWPVANIKLLIEKEG